jgi:proteic killer suppression protein
MPVSISDHQLSMCGDGEDFSGPALSKTRHDMQRTAFRKLLHLHRAVNLLDLGSLPGNRLESLKGDRAGQHSIRINDQWRICFRWTDNGVAEVEIVDYHR